MEDTLAFINFSMCLAPSGLLKEVVFRQPLIYYMHSSSTQWTSPTVCIHKLQIYPSGNDSVTRSKTKTAVVQKKVAAFS